MNENPYVSPKTTEFSEDRPERATRWRLLVSAVLCLIGTSALLTLDGQVLTNTLIFLLCWSASLTIWVLPLWRARRNASRGLLFGIGLHVVAITWGCLGMRNAYNYQKHFNERREWRRANEWLELRETEEAADPESPR